ncbi:MAG TPA: hypothetical protein VEH06_04205 [Candidatus Bathyarchaeia archaeon]|nr:hypothetical protein [Candidatus Bathyarchaeia archaeon]
MSVVVVWMVMSMIVSMVVVWMVMSMIVSMVSVGVNVRINTTIQIEDHGKLVSLRDKLKQKYKELPSDT